MGSAPGLLNETRTSGQRVFGFNQNAKALGDVAVAFDQTAQVFAEAVLVHLGAGLDVPQPAAIGADLVSQHDTHQVAFIEAAAFDLEINQLDADAHEQAGEEVVDADGQAHDVVEFSRGCPAKGGDVLFADHGVMQRIVLVAELDDRAGQLGAGLKAQALDQRAGGKIAHDDLKRNDFHFLDQLFAHVHAPNEVRGNAQAVQLGEDELRDSVVQHALAVDDFMTGRSEEHTSELQSRPHLV